MIVKFRLHHSDKLFFHCVVIYILKRITVKIKLTIEIQTDINTVGIVLMVSNDYKGLKNVKELCFVYKDAVK